MIVNSNASKWKLCPFFLSKHISLKVNVITKLKFKLTYFKATVPYTMGLSQWLINLCVHIYICIYQPLHMSWRWHKVSFLCRVKQVWTQSFPSPRLVAIPRLKNPTISPIAGGRIVGFIFFPRILALYINIYIYIYVRFVEY